MAEIVPAKVPLEQPNLIGESNQTQILINNFKDYVDFEVDSPHHQEFAGSVGLLGSYNTGTKLARDGKTVIDDADAFGQEWQVRVTDNQLFSVVDGPQYPAGHDRSFPEFGFGGHWRHAAG